MTHGSRSAAAWLRLLRRALTFAGSEPTSGSSANAARAPKFTARRSSTAEKAAVGLADPETLC